MKVVSLKVIVVALLLVICAAVKAQNKVQANLKNNISLMFSNKADMDCVVTELLKDIRGVKVIFSCTQAGLMVLESEELAANTLKEKLTAHIVAKKEKIQFDIIESYSAAKTSGTSSL